MSVTASIDFRIAENKTKIAIRKIVEYFLDFGWSLNDDGKVTYLPSGDEDFDWRSESIQYDTLIKIFEAKERNKETIGIILTWKETGVGGQFLFWENGDFSVNLNVNRKMIEYEGTYNSTDVSWYLIRLLPALLKSEVIIENITFQENI
jgi:hypothetical protein